MSARPDQAEAIDRLVNKAAAHKQVMLAHSRLEQARIDLAVCTKRWIDDGVEQDSPLLEDMRFWAKRIDAAEAVFEAADAKFGGES